MKRFICLAALALALVATVAQAQPKPTVHLTPGESVTVAADNEAPVTYKVTDADMARWARNLPTRIIYRDRTVPGSVTVVHDTTLVYLPHRWWPETNMMFIPNWWPALFLFAFVFLLGALCAGGFRGRDGQHGISGLPGRDGRDGRDAVSTANGPAPWMRIGNLDEGTEITIKRDRAAAPPPQS